MATITNSNLQHQLEVWVEQCGIALDLPLGSQDRSNAIKEFCRGFVPTDVSVEDMEHYAAELAADEEFFNSISRELTQCALNRGVENIEGDQIEKAIFTLVPLALTAVDIVREIGFISIDGGLTWTAELERTMKCQVCGVTGPSSLSITPFKHVSTNV